MPDVIDESWDVEEIKSLQYRNQEIGELTLNQVENVLKAGIGDVFYPGTALFREMAWEKML